MLCLFSSFLFHSPLRCLHRSVMVEEQCHVASPPRASIFSSSSSSCLCPCSSPVKGITHCQWAIFYEMVKLWCPCVGNLNWDSLAPQIRHFDVLGYGTAKSSTLISFDDLFCFTPLFASISRFTSLKLQALSWLIRTFLVLSCLIGITTLQWNQLYGLRTETILCPTKMES